MQSENKFSGKPVATEIISSRIFDAPREVVFNAWENPELLKTWWGPKDFTNSFHQFDFKAGGLWKFTMHGPDGMAYQNENVFEKIIKPELIIFNHLEPNHIFKATTTLEEMNNKTKLTFRMLFESAEEYEKVKAFIIIANEQNFDRLEAVLLKQHTPH